MRRAHLPWRSTIMARTMPLLVSLLVIPLLAQAAQSAPTQPVPWHPCAQIAAACTQAGFVRNGAKMGAGIMVDCIQPIIAGTPPRPCRKSTRRSWRRAISGTRTLERKAQRGRARRVPGRRSAAKLLTKDEARRLEISAVYKRPFPLLRPPLCLP
jgi:hypothetical protein